MGCLRERGWKKKESLVTKTKRATWKKKFVHRNVKKRGGPTSLYRDESSGTKGEKETEHWKKRPCKGGRDSNILCSGKG